MPGSSVGMAEKAPYGDISQLRKKMIYCTSRASMGACSENRKQDGSEESPRLNQKPRKIKGEISSDNVYVQNGYGLSFRFLPFLFSLLHRIQVWRKERK